MSIITIAELERRMDMVDAYRADVDILTIADEYDTSPVATTDILIRYRAIKRCQRCEMLYDYESADTCPDCRAEAERRESHRSLFESDWWLQRNTVPA